MSTSPAAILVSIPDLLTYLCSFLDARTYLAFIRTSNGIRQLLDSEMSWKRFFNITFQKHEEDFPDNVYIKTWKSYFMNEYFKNKRHTLQPFRIDCTLSTTIFKSHIRFANGTLYNVMIQDNYGRPQAKLVLYNNDKTLQAAKKLLESEIPDNKRKKLSEENYFHCDHCRSPFENGRKITMLYGLPRHILLCSQQCQREFNPEIYFPAIKTVVMAIIGEGMSDDLLQGGRELAKQHKMPFVELRPEDRVAMDTCLQAIVSNDIFVKHQKNCIIS